MQTVDLRLNVPTGFSVEEFIAKINGYVDRLAKKRQEKALQKAKLDTVMSIAGAFSDCKISEDWKSEKAEYLEQKYK